MRISFIIEQKHWDKKQPKDEIVSKNMSNNEKNIQSYNTGKPKRILCVVWTLNPSNV